MDGYEAAGRIRGELRRSSLPIVAMTAHAMVEEKERCIAVGMIAHLAKPVLPEELFRTLASICAETSEPPAGSQDAPPPAQVAACG